MKRETGERKGNRGNERHVRGKRYWHAASCMPDLPRCPTRKRAAASVGPWARPPPISARSRDPSSNRSCSVSSHAMVALLVGLAEHKRVRCSSCHTHGERQREERRWASSRDTAHGFVSEQTKKGRCLLWWRRSTVCHWRMEACWLKQLLYYRLVVRIHTQHRKAIEEKSGGAGAAAGKEREKFVPLPTLNFAYPPWPLDSRVGRVRLS